MSDAKPISMYCRRCGYDVSHQGDAAPCSECGTRCDPRDPSTYHVTPGGILRPRSAVQRGWTAWCAIVSLLPLLAVVPGAPGLGTVAGAIIIGAFGPIGTLMFAIVLTMPGAAQDASWLVPFAFAAPVQWVPIWILGMRAMSPRHWPRRRTFLILLLAYLGLCAVSVSVFTHLIEANFGA